MSSLFVNINIPSCSVRFIAAILMVNIWHKILIEGNSFKAFSKIEKSLIFKPPAVFWLITAVFFIQAGLWFQTKSKVIWLTSLLESLGVSVTLQMKTSFDRANVLTKFILPYKEMSLWDHIFNVFFSDPNLSKQFLRWDTSRSYQALDGGSWSRIPAPILWESRHFYIAFSNPVFSKKKTIVSAKTNYKFNGDENKSRFAHILGILSCCQTALCIIAM